jgi:hypothetical protein
VARGRGDIADGLLRHIITAAVAMVICLAGSASAAVDTSPPAPVSVESAPVQDVLSQRAVELAVVSSEDGSARATARIYVSGSKRKPFRAIGLLRRLTANQERTFRLLVTKKTRERLAGPLADGRRVTARVRVSIRDEAGNAVVTHEAIRLR